MRWTCLLSALVLATWTESTAATSLKLPPVACCSTETTLVFREAEYPGASHWDRSAFKCQLHDVQVSEDGRFRACTYVMEGEEGGEAILLCDGNRLLGLQAFARAVAWEPGGSRLLCDEAAADDDLRMFVLDVGRGEYSKHPADRLHYIVGKRGDQFLRWQGDSIWVRNYFTTTGQGRWLKLPPRGR